MANEMINKLTISRLSNNPINYKPSSCNSYKIPYTRCVSVVSQLQTSYSIGHEPDMLLIYHVRVPACTIFRTIAVAVIKDGMVAKLKRESIEEIRLKFQLCIIGNSSLNQHSEELANVLKPNMTSANDTV
ncbi:hypothetical protein BD770DRAFT_415387 [Pilaira anomala]|nr:hypothetical protein BD770DRAFT_415387 [Pilaira anomala]